MKLAIASLSLLLAACNAPEPSSADSTPPAGAPVATTPAPAAAPMAKRAPGQENADPLQVFRAFGTEPFWNVNVEDATLTYTTPEDQAGMVMQGERHSVTGGVEIAGSHAGKSFTLTLTEGMCSDGMSDNRYTLISTFRYGDIDYRGCGEAAK
ncbi:COG3650 family protein [Thermomonas aquatica]|uniref:Lipoprotein n=1 Tax=Thermomonas aquatica TaxID=2202149 RepID=A0A5B7ZP07_9GAMM|nr:hypothetical protein [Thermomonas aquatica]QDA56637.1 hypothetical protein FHQ07_04565 [Thermomonas aquatica]